MADALQQAMELLDQQQWAACEQLLGSILHIDPNHPHALQLLADLHARQGHYLGNSGHLDKAVRHYNKAIQIDPHHYEAQANLGVVHTLRGDPDQALIHFLQTQTLNGQIPDSHYMMGMNHRQAGRIEEAKNCFQAYLTQAAPPAEAASEWSQRFEEVIALQHFGRSGTLWLHSLFDSHPHISTIPGVRFNDFFTPSVQAHLIPDHNQPHWRSMLVDRFVECYRFLFDPCGLRYPSENDDAARVGLNCMGDHRDHQLSLDETAFGKHLHTLLKPHTQMDTRTLFKLVHQAFDQTLRRDVEASRKILFHSHNSQGEGFRHLLAHFPKVRLLTAVREPVQSLESLLYDTLFNTADPKSGHQQVEMMRQEFRQALYQQASGHLQVMWGNMLLAPHGVIPSAGVRLEDLKTQPQAMMTKLAEWIGIDFHESLFQSSFQGVPYWGPSSKLSPKLRAFDNSGVKRKVGALFSQRDTFLFATLLYPIRVHFGYQPRDDDTFRRDLKKCRSMLYVPLDFEKEWLDGQPPEAHPAYRAFHNNLKAIWRTLNMRTQRADNWQGLPQWLRL
ncbi:MAG: tetratricopeptide repeat protein [Magnetococcales bacterium]|nr:tetratricopeptide repeat protein [Magnetococcales bacterium]